MDFDIIDKLNDREIFELYNNTVNEIIDNSLLIGYDCACRSSVTSGCGYANSSTCQMDLNGSAYNNASDCQSRCSYLGLSKHDWNFGEQHTNIEDHVYYHPFCYSVLTRYCDKTRTRM